MFILQEHIPGWFFQIQRGESPQKFTLLSPDQNHGLFMTFFWNPACANRLNQSDFLILPNLFPQLSTDPKKVVMWNVNWKINMIDGKWPWRRHFHNSSPPAWDAPDLCAACLLVSPRWVLYTIFVATAEILGDAYHKTDMVSLYPQVRRWSWWWEIMGNILSLVVIFIQTVYIYYLWKYTLFDINFVHSDYLL